MLALQPSERCTIRAQTASEADKGTNTPLAGYFEMTNMEVEHVSAINLFLAGTKTCCNQKNQEGVHRVWRVQW